MGFTEFEYTKSWRNADDFATYESSEERVRDDMQCLYDEAAAAINRLISEIKAGNIPFTPTASIDSTDLQNALENVQSQIEQTTLGNLPDNSIVESKLKPGSVTTEKLADGSVTQVKLGEKAVGEPNMDDNSVSGRTIQAKAITRDKMADGVYDDKADLVKGKVKPEQVSMRMITVVESRTLELGDAGALLLLNGANITLTIPANSSVQLPVGTEIALYRACSDAVTVYAAEGVTLQTPGGRTPLGRQYTFVRLKKLQANLWACDTLDVAGSDDIADNAILTRHIANKAVTSAKLSADAKDIILYNTEVALDAFAEDATNKNFGIKCTVPIASATEEMIPEIVFTDAIVEEISPSINAQTAEGVITFNCEDKPKAAITIPTIILRRPGSVGSAGSGTSTTYENYEGAYNVTPSVVEQTLPTRDKYLSDDIDISGVPKSTTTNSGGGKTVSIGG